MKTIVKTHPLKDIILEFDESKEQLDIETKALSRYDEAHDEVWKMKQRLDYLAKGLTEVMQEVSDRQVELLAMEQSLDFVEDSLGLSDGKNLPELEDEITIDVTALFQDMEQHSADLNALYAQVDDLTKRYNYEVDLYVPSEDYEENWPIHSSFFGLFDEVYERYEEVSLNIVTLDDDEQEFLGVYGELYDAYHENLEFAVQVFDAYAALVERVNPLYDRASRAMTAMNQKMRRDLGEE